MTSHALQRVVVAVAVAGGAAAAVVLLPRWRARRKIRRMPKVELHAHLNGSIRGATLAELAAAKGLDAGVLGEPRTLENCFKIFKLIHDCVDSLDIVKRVAREALEDFAADGCASALRRPDGNRIAATPRPGTRPLIRSRRRRG